MAVSDSQTSAARLREARALLATPAPRTESLTAVTAAAAFFAISALTLAVAVVMMPTPWPT
jgi:hypothetical protein